jgi:drug/metabolite transporter (DMT)-like permease
MGSIPLWVALLDRVVFGKRLHRLAGVGLVTGFLGLALLVDPFGEGRIDRVGAAVAVFAAFAWAAGSLYSRGAPLPRRPIVAAGLAALCGGVLLTAVAAATGELGEARFTPEAVAAVAYLVVFGTLLGFSAYVWLLRVAPTSLVATYAYVNPIVAVFLGWTLLGEEISLSMLAAGAAIVVSVALIVGTSNRVTEPGRGLRRSSTEPASELRPPP